MQLLEHQVVSALAKDQRILTPGFDDGSLL
jgi:hypothetical protein